MTDDPESPETTSTDAASTAQDPLALDAADVAQTIGSAPVTGAATPDTAADVERDRDGVPFDPARHQKRRKKDGTWKAKPSEPAKTPKAAPRPRSAAGAGPLHETVSGSYLPPQEPGDTAPPPDYRATARVMAASLMSPLAMLLGQEWLADREELEVLTDAWEGYFRARGIVEMPPEMMLALAYSGYVGKRLAQEKPRARASAVVGGLWGGIKGWWRARREPKLERAGRITVEPPPAPPRGSTEWGGDAPTNGFTSYVS